MKPQSEEVAELKREVALFIDKCLSGPPEAQWFGTDSSPFRFELAYHQKSEVVINYVLLQPEWEGHGIFTSLILHLSAAPEIVQIGVKSALTPEIQKRLKKLRFVELGDQDFILRPKESRIVAAIQKALKRVKRVFTPN